MTINTPNKVIKTSRRFLVFSGVLFCLTMSLTSLVPVFADDTAQTPVDGKSLSLNTDVVSPGTIESLQESGKDIILTLDNVDIKESVKNAIANVTAKTIEDKYPNLPALVIKDASTSDVQAVSALSGIKSIESDEVVSVDAYTHSEVLDSINATTIIGQGAHSADYTGSGVTIGIVDAGINDQIDTFKTSGNTRIIHEECFGTDTGVAPCNTTPGQEAHITCTSTTDVGCFHGNAVADFAAGTRVDGTSNSTAVSTGGVAYGANISFTRVTETADGSFSSIDLTYALLNFLDDVNNNRSYAPDVINLSLGLQNVSWCTTGPSITSIIHDLTLKGVPVVVAAGNSGTTSGLKSQLAYPACLTDTISVGATEFTGPSFTVPKVADYSQNSSTLDLVAPGTDLYATTPNPNGTTIIQASGTSFSAPIVTGSVAVIKEFLADKGFNNYTVEQIKDVLANNGTAVDDPAISVNSKSIDLEAAIAALTADAPTTTTTVPGYTPPSTGSTKNLDVAITTSVPEILAYDDITLSVKLTNTGSVDPGSVVTTLYPGNGTPVAITSNVTTATSNVEVISNTISGAELLVYGAYAESCFGTPTVCVRTNVVTTDVLSAYVDISRTVVGTPGNYTVTDTINNAGDYAITNMSAVDSVLGTLTLPSTSLAIGASMTVTQTIATIPTDMSFPITVTGTAGGITGKLFDDTLVLISNSGTSTTLASATTKAVVNNASGSLPVTGTESKDVTTSALWLLLAGLLLLSIKLPELNKRIRKNRV